MTPFPAARPAQSIPFRPSSAGRFRGNWRRALCVPFAALVLGILAACNGSAVVTLTATPSTDSYLAYRVGLVSIQLQTSNGRTTGAVLPKGSTVDLARLTNLSEVVGAATLAQGNYSEALVTLDYSSAQIIYDNGTVDGVALKPVNASGQGLGQVTILLYLDPSDQLGVVRGSSARLSLGFNLAASNVVNVAQRTVTVTPLISASTQSLDSKVVRIRGPLSNVNSSNTGFLAGITPFDFGNSGAGSLGVSAQSVTTFEINGTPSTGSAGMTQMAALKSGVMVEAFGTLTTSTSTSSSLGTDTAASTTEVQTCSDGSTPTEVNGVMECTDGATLTTSTEDASDTNGLTPTNVNFSASQVLAGSSVQGDGFDRVSGVVTGRSGDTLTIDQATLLTDEGVNTLVTGTATVKVGLNTKITQFGGAGAVSNGAQDISVGSLIYAFGTASAIGSSSVTLDASAGRVRIGQTTVSGLVTAQPTSDSLTLNLATYGTLGGRLAGSFDFTGTGTSAGTDASITAYQVSTANLTLTNATVGTPVQVTGTVTPFASATPPDLAGTALLDYTTINAELVMDYGAGTPAPFVSYSTSEIVLDARNSAVGVRHEIQTGAQIVNLVGIPTDPNIVPNTSAANSIFTIAHVVSGTAENFDTYSTFVTQLQTELNGDVLVTGVTATGQYTNTSYTFSASSITLILNN
jgi:hypothetical protein